MSENDIPTCERCGSKMERTQRLPEAISFDFVCSLPAAACQSIAAVARHSARAQQAETKKEKRHD